MPRPLRFDVANVPQHVVQRGNNRQRTFVDERDRVRYLTWLRRAAQERCCEIHAYVLMSNHVHLLVTPRAPMAIADLMQSLGRRYVRYFNDRRERTGTLWEGRYKATLVDSEPYLWMCYRYIEQNPVRAGMVESASQYRWSSFARNALGRADLLVTEHSVYTELGDAPETRAAEYARLFEDKLSEKDLDRVRDDLNCCGRRPSTSDQ
jgi:putative transposase